MSNGLLYSADYNWMTHEVRLLDKSGNAILRFFPDVGTDDISKPLTFISKEDYSHVTLRANGTVTNEYEYMTAWGSGEWEPYTLGTNITLMQGNAVSFRISARNMAQDSSHYVYFTVDGKIEAWNNVQSLVDVGDYTLTMPDYGLYRLFMRQGGITKSPLMPATTVGAYAYSNAFYECLLLTRAPEILPATVLGVSCYRAMFYGCSRLTNAPSILATTLPQYACSGMFSSCRAISEVRIASTDISATNCLQQWLSVVSSTGDFYCDPNTAFPSGISGIPTGWNRWVYGAEDTGTTTTMYHNGVAETVRIGTSNYGTCYSIQGWAGFRTLEPMHSAGYTIGVQTAVTLYHEGSPVSAYFCDANQDDGFTETMYYIEGTWVDSATAYMDGYYPEDFIKPLMFKSKTSDATISTNATNLVVSRNMTDWDAYTANTALPVGVDECVYFKANTNGGIGTKFTLTGNFEAGGNILSVYRTDFTTHSGKGYNFSEMFKNQTGLLKAPMLTPTYIGTTMYNSMFEGCTGLEEDAPLPPVLTFAGISSPYSDLGYYFYNMYKGCTGLLRIRSFQNYESATVSGGSYGLGTCLSLATFGMSLSIGSGVTIDMYQSVKLPVVVPISNSTIHDTRLGSASIETIPEPFYLKHTQDWNLSLISENYDDSKPSVDDMLISSSAYYEYSYNRVDWFYGASRKTPAPLQIPANTKIYIRKYRYAPSYLYMYNAGTSLKPDLKFVYGGAGLCTQRGFYFTEDCEVGGDIRSLDSANYYEQQPYAQNLQSLFSCVMKRKRAIYASYPCTGLTKSLNLSASSYGHLDYMYYGCSSLNEVRINATNVTSLTDWLNGVAASGTVYANSSLSLPTNSTSGVPSGWTREDIANYPTT